MYEVTYVPKLNYPWKHEPPQYNHGRILMETTLEGLLAGYEGGVFAPRSREEMFRNAIAQQMLRTASLDRLAELGIDGILVPTCSSVADRAHLNPRFNYLTYDVADVDWQLGATWDFMRLIDALYDKGLALVPDLTFAHQVKAPFPGSLDEVRHPKTQAFPFVDTQAFAFRDRGTWMFKLEDPHLRRQIVEKSWRLPPATISPSCAWAIWMG
ncbi:MAG: hypothetical protein HC925_05905 [Coleofasciculaceae cyanobacterium SM2_3_26]|nr:hypothetical protein [Coleofasciculaceae cyanobacterium SM2_3_26]